MVPSTVFELFRHLQKYEMVQLVFFSASQLGRVGLPLLIHLHNTAGGEDKGQEEAFFSLPPFSHFLPISNSGERKDERNALSFPRTGKSENVFVG